MREREFLRYGMGLALLLAFGRPGGLLADEPPNPLDPVDVVVVDAGHGGEDHGAVGANGRLEKDIALEVARRTGRRLAATGFRVVYTREADQFVPLAERTRIANEAGGDLFVSIHANSATTRRARGPETYFLSVEASDDESMRVAMTENAVFAQEAAAPDSADVVGAILGDLIRTEHLRESSELARDVQRELSGLAPGRGVKQAPFAVLMGANMPAVLIEIGFLSHAGEARRLADGAHQESVARAIASAIVRYRDLRDGSSRTEGSE